MTLFRREPRSVYRVYAEDEYLDGDHQPLALDGLEPSPAVAARPGSGEWNRGGLLAAGLIVAVAVAAVAIIFAAGHHPSHRRVAAATRPVPEHGNRAELYRPRRSTLPPRRSAVVSEQARSRSTKRQPVAPVPRPMIAAAAPAFAPLRPDAQLEFGFER